MKDIEPETLMKNFSFVFQDVTLFNDTIEGNIRFGRPDAGRLPNYAGRKRRHPVRRGRQRISIARAILKDAPIVIQDEAMASIDPENEHLIQQAISRLALGKTVLVIAHRLATIEQADQILVVDQGWIVQKGTHPELARQEGLYRRFLAIRERAEGWRIGWRKGMD